MDRTPGLVMSDLENVDKLKGAHIALCRLNILL